MTPIELQDKIYRQLAKALRNTRKMRKQQDNCACLECCAADLQTSMIVLFQELSAGEE